MLLRDLIREHFTKMSKSQKKVANYVLDHPNDIALYSAAEFGSKIGISESTVIRFSNSLGFSGYTELQKLVREQFFKESSLTSYQQSKMDIPKDMSFHKQVMEQDRESILATMNQIDELAYQATVQRLSNAKSVYVLGLRSSYSAANWLSFSLGLVKENVHFIRPDTEDVIRTIMKMDEHSVVIIISFHRYLKETIEIAGLIRNQKSYIIGISDSILAPIHAYSDVLFPIYAANKSTLDAVSPLFSFMNAIVAGLIVEQKEDFMKRQALYETIPSHFLFEEGKDPI
ncbi:MurR/RpiR family transcriptional regulator [Psychrobacillus sp. NEAU-3TGS]|uniref:MurR/RpiR family transcriptional regulator n=1 Tax=Psychrobacillus sp. NEAU-3TGS TaxID=2995412 RepID=UPI002498E894|nr:MurR/RpiR family transcriptional regulator [Psychrobacillus sp. NEAU-3TGS]MDI2589801.1 MurR/RpiR family transcriptional regulator [Psychrobacillus sp. NEAU-3TGS]